MTEHSHKPKFVPSGATWKTTSVWIFLICIISKDIRLIIKSINSAINCLTIRAFLNWFPLVSAAI